MARARADIANTALRIFLQEMGAAYDEERHLIVYDGKKHFTQVREVGAIAMTLIEAKIKRVRSKL